MITQKKSGFTTTIFLTGIFCLMMCMVCPAVFAQDYSKVDIFVGYSLMKVGGEYDNMKGLEKFGDLDENWWGEKRPKAEKSNLLKKGFSASAAYNFTPVLGIEAFLQRNTGDVFNASWKASVRDNEYYGYTESREAKANLKRSNFAFLVGPRLTYRNFSEKVTPFVHGLVGISKDSASYSDEWSKDEQYNDRPEWNDQDSTKYKFDLNHTSFAFALGGGLDVSINEKFAIRVIQADYYLASHPKKLYDPHHDTNSQNFIFWDDDSNAEMLFKPPDRNENKMFGNVNLTFGVVFRLGK